MLQSRVDASKLDLKETIVNIRRVAKTVKGGRNIRFSVTVVIGDGEGHVGVGLGKAQEIPEAVRKAIESAKKKFDICSSSGNYDTSQKYGDFRCGQGSFDPRRGRYRRNCGFIRARGA